MAHVCLYGKYLLKYRGSFIHQHPESFNQIGVPLPFTNKFNIFYSLTLSNTCGIAFPNFKIRMFDNLGGLIDEWFRKWYLMCAIVGDLKPNNCVIYLSVTAMTDQQIQTQDLKSTSVQQFNVSCVGKLNGDFNVR